MRHRQWAAHWRYSRAVPFARCRGTNLPGLNGRNALMLCSVGGVLHSPSATHLPRRSYPGALGLNAPGYFVRLTLTPCRWERDLLSMSCEMRASIPLPASRVDPGPIDAASWDRGFDSVIRRRQAVTSDMSLSNGAPCLCVPGPIVIRRDTIVEGTSQGPIAGDLAIHEMRIDPATLLGGRRPTLP